jgi:thioredoxin-related protein
MSTQFDPHDFFDLANDLESNSESANRTILNRCYYSCYLRIKDECTTKKGIDDHLSHDIAFYKVNMKNKKLGGL